MKRVLPVLCLAGLSWVWAAQDQDEVKLPEGPGKKQVELLCSKCHELEGFSSSRNTRERWEAVVDEMISRGAEGTDEDFELIINYLAKYLGRTNINKATEAELVEGLTIPKETAAALIAYRQKSGPYKKWDDLAKVPGVDIKKLVDKKGAIEF